MTHNEKNRDKLIAEIKLQYGETPVTVWYDRNQRRYVTKEALDRVNRDFSYSRRFDLVGTINIDTDRAEIKRMLLETERLNKHDFPIPTSLQNMEMNDDDS